MSSDASEVREEARLAEEIRSLARERKAVILAHNYQVPEVQDIADFVGDSLRLSQIAAKVKADVIIFCGVSFMAESAAILAPDKIVVLPVPDAGCPMADMVTREALIRRKRELPGMPVVCYVNSSADVKAESDICCTSSNAVSIVESLPEDEVLFIPDRNLGSWVAGQTKKKVVLWDGYCLTHHRVTLRDLEAARAAHPDAVVMVHPECRPEVTARADVVCSTEKMVQYARGSPARKFLVGTEMGLLYKLKKENPDKEFYLLSPGLICPNMKKTRLVHVREALRNCGPRVTVPEHVRVRARVALDRMLAVSDGAPFPQGGAH